MSDTTPSLLEAKARLDTIIRKARLDTIIRKARVDLYKPIQIAEVLYHSRLGLANVDTLDLETYRNPSVHWRNSASKRLLGKVSTSSAKFQDNIWEMNAMPPSLLATLDEENKRTQGAIEKYIYLRFQERQETVGSIVTLVESATPENFDITALFEVFETNPGVRRSVDKVYEVVVYSLMETIVTVLEAYVTVSVSQNMHHLLAEFSDITKLLFGLSEGQLSYTLPAHVYRAGVTNAADRGLDMWTNFGPTIQVKHLTLNPKKAEEIVDQIEGDNIIVVCQSADIQVIETVLRQINWGRKVRGIVSEKDLIAWYERCLKGKYANQLAQRLLRKLSEEFKREFARTLTIGDFLEERRYIEIPSPSLWSIDLLQELKDTQE